MYDILRGDGGKAWSWTLTSDEQIIKYTLSLTPKSKEKLDKRYVFRTKCGMGFEGTVFGNGS